MGCTKGNLEGNSDIYFNNHQKAKGGASDGSLVLHCGLGRPTKETGKKEIYTQLLPKRKVLEILETDKIKKNLIYLKRETLAKDP